jgi:hypothetical protein
VVEPDRTQVKIIRRMRIACWITKATDTHSEYETFIALARQQCLLECATFLCYTYFIYLALDGLDLEDGTDRCSETLVTTNVRYVTSEKNEVLTGTPLFTSKILLNEEVLELEGKAPLNSKLWY